MEAKAKFKVETKVKMEVEVKVKMEVEAKAEVEVKVEMKVSNAFYFECTRFEVVFFGQQDFDKEGWTIQDILAMKYAPCRRQTLSGLSRN
ncbi:hypothetical protein M8J77_014865 [Diaphorina citri]|nr:hypothetical protein M8J77_014865 [Diaphorina citri]